MIDLLGNWTDFLYEENPPESIFDDLSFTIPDFVEGYFKSYFKPERSKREDPKGMRCSEQHSNMLRDK